VMVRISMMLAAPYIAGGRVNAITNWHGFLI